jgi:hypothetical protein
MSSSTRRRVSPTRARAWIAARLLADLLRSPDDRRAGHLAQREHELVRLVLDQEVVGEDDGLLLEVDPFEGAQFLHGGGHHAL